MKKILFAGICFIVSCTAGFASPILCASVTNLGQLLGAADGCTIQDKLFTDFTYTGSVPAAQVGASPVFSVGPGSDLHGWIFSPSPVWTSGFSLGYVISVLPGNPDVHIEASKLQINTGFSSGVMTTETQNGGALPTLNASSGTETSQVTFPLTDSISVLNTVTIPSGSRLISLENDFLETTTSSVPEPLTTALLGGGLIMLGLVGTRRKLPKA